MPLRLWLVNFEGATCCKVAAKLCRAGDDSENWTIDCANAEDRTTGTIDQAVSETFVSEAHGASAM